MPPRRRLSLSLSGSDFPIYLLDNSSFVLRLTPAITVGSAIIAIREQVGLDYDAHHALFELLADGELIQLDDDKHFVRIIGRWQQESVSEGACRVGGGQDAPCFAARRCARRCAHRRRFITPRATAPDPNFPPKPQGRTEYTLSARSSSPGRSPPTRRSGTGPARTASHS